MILEYLVSDEKFKEEIFKYREENLNINVKDIKSSNFWIAEFMIEVENEQSALVLSKINKDIIKCYNCITLTNESAFYYNKKLYPLVNEFERKLRKILYLASKLSSDSSDAEVIQNLENMDFGTLFDIIFTDEDFIQNIRKKINQKTWKFNKKEIIDDLFDIEENTLWDKLLGTEIAPTLRENFVIIKKYRNNIMHAHNITAEDYKKRKEMFLITNEELDIDISDILNNKIKKLYKGSSQNFAKTLSEAINTEKLKDITNIYNYQLKEISKAAELATASNLGQQLKEISKAAELATASNLSQQLKEVSKAAELATASNLGQQLKEISKTAEFATASTLSQQLKESSKVNAIDFKDNKGEEEIDNSK